jgi:hypothetical protein
MVEFYDRFIFMEILTRKAAIALGENKYFTGKPCKNGHVAARYVQSATCELCIRPLSTSSALTESRLSLTKERLEIEKKKLELKERRLALIEQEKPQKAVERALRQTRIKSKSELVGYRVRLWDKDLGTYREIVRAVSSERQPALQLGDIFSSAPPTGRAGESGMYAFYCFQEDAANLKAIGVTLYNSSIQAPTAAEIEEKRQEIIKNVEAESAEQWPEWKA